jgi:hypothetical protein
MEKDCMLSRYTVLLQNVEDYVLLHAWVFTKNMYINFMKAYSLFPSNFDACLALDFW